MEHTIINQMDEQYLDFLNDLRKLNKDELIDFIGDYWIALKEEADNGRKQKDVLYGN